MNVRTLVTAVLLLPVLSACSSFSDMLAKEQKAPEIRKTDFDNAVAYLVGDYLIVDGQGFDNGFGFAANYSKVKATVEGGQLKIVVLDKREGTWKLNGQQCRGQIASDTREQAVTCDASIFYLDGLSQEFTLAKSGQDRNIGVNVTSGKYLALPVRKGDYILSVRWKRGWRETCIRLVKA